MINKTKRELLLVLLPTLILFMALLPFYSQLNKTVGEGNHRFVNSVKTNANGQTFGSASMAKSVEEVPDLISAIATNGAEGYIKKSDVHQDRAATPAEAIAMQDAEINTSTRTIPVYAVDGITVIGTFEMRKSAETTTKPAWLSK